MVNGLETQKIIQAINKALLLAEAQEVNVSPGDITLLRELEITSEQVLGGLNGLIDVMLRYHTLWLANDIDTTITNTADDEIPDGAAKFKKERWQELRATFLSFSTWLNTPIMLPDDEEGAPTGAIPLISLAKRVQ